MTSTASGYIFDPEEYFSPYPVECQPSWATDSSGFSTAMRLDQRHLQNHPGESSVKCFKLCQNAMQTALCEIQSEQSEVMRQFQEQPETMSFQELLHADINLVDDDTFPLPLKSLLHNSTRSYGPTEHVVDPDEVTSQADVEPLGDDTAPPITQYRVRLACLECRMAKRKCSSVESSEKRRKDVPVSKAQAQVLADDVKDMEKIACLSSESPTLGSRNTTSRISTACDFRKTEKHRCRNIGRHQCDNNMKHGQRCLFTVQFQFEEGADSSPNPVAMVLTED
ncbi:hypothetical protein CGMCC3_g17757 [Colletotrichum fructicola]|nr:uncharacterized protein CGMCC3_g17757 [Colletotrichum fructicola]KAE9566075.1 hypothetical protein CGMCC3_g17757 [Colletotrichum fructicola]